MQLMIERVRPNGRTLDQRIWQALPNGRAVTTEITVGELKQTVVDVMKAAHQDSKLTKEEIAQLGQLLYEKTTAKLSTSAMDVLTAVQVDISALITGTAEHLIGQMKEDQG